ncbi:MAG: thioredoxin domain-containing protein, partial [Verrucomicrobiota bacterium]
MPNALAHEKSPYLLQHADNPVAWLPWGEAAFAKARAEQKPIFLSIGYSTCHWCHVMAHESFEHADIAALLNAHFVPVKVDREERPDVDKIYMTYVQGLTGHGGWPLSAWLTPELKPFHGGTYFPPEDRQGRPGLVSVLRAIAKGWAEGREKLVAEADRVIGVLRAQLEPKVEDKGPGAGRGAARLADVASGARSADSRLAEAGGEAFGHGFQHFYEAFDTQHGGFGGAPKFPCASNLNFLFRVTVLQGEDSGLGREAGRMATVTLQKMAGGGIHDHVGGGFHRYAVDAGWLVPHFEKMLYDQAQIAVNVLDAYLATGDERFAWVARGIFDYVLRDLLAPGGGLYSAEDADSLLPETAKPGEGGEGCRVGTRAKAEGAFYTWTHAEIVSVLGADAGLFCAHFGVRPEGNVREQLDPHGEFTGKNILAQTRPLAETARKLGLDLLAAVASLGGGLEKLRLVRAARPRPHLDDKIITAWNGLMLSAFARGATSPAECLGAMRGRCRTAAVRVAGFIERELWDDARGVL